MSDYSQTFIADGEMRSIADWLARAVDAQIKARINEADKTAGPFGPSELDDFASWSAACHLLRALVDGNPMQARHLYHLYRPGGVRESSRAAVAHE